MLPCLVTPRSCLPRATALALARRALTGGACARSRALHVALRRRAQLTTSSRVAAVVRGYSGLAGAGALRVARRWQTTSEAASSASEAGASQRTEAEIVQYCKWASADMAERLGFAAGESITAEQLKRHFFVLAMHFHPDSPTAPQNSTQAFQNIKEAHDKVAQELKLNGGGGRGEGSSSYFYNPFDDYRASTRQDGFHFKDEARRRAQMRLLGDGVVLFVLLIVLFACVVARQNRVRLNSTYLGNLLGIFVVVQIFPRLLAAAVLFAWQTVYLVRCASLAAQAEVSLVLERQPATNELCVSVKGIPPDMEPHVVVQVDIKTSRATAAKTELQPTQVVTTTTLTLDPGVTRFRLPLVDDTTHTTYTIRGVDRLRNMVVLDKTLQLE